jgi:hypothetical protein
MSILRQIKRLKFIDFLVRKKATGSLQTFAKKNSLSKRGLTNIIEEMREMGFPIKFSRQLNSYYYEEDGEMVQYLFIKKGQILSREELSHLVGNGTNNLCFSKTNVFEVCDNGGTPKQFREKNKK